MAARSSAPKPKKPAAASSEGVEAFLASLEHPQKPAILAIRQTILGAHSTILEGIKWNAPSFRTSEYFATFHLRAKVGVQIILHLGAKRRVGSKVELDDPASLLEWLGADRASVKFRDIRDVEAKQAAFIDLIRLWIQHV